MVRDFSFLERLVTSFERNLLNSLGTHFYSFEEIDGLLEELANQASSFRPDCVVGILNSGEYSGRKIAEILSCDYQGIDVSRDIVSFAGVPLNDRLLFNKMISGGGPKLKNEFIDNGYDRVLIVDEDGGSGRTLALAKEEICTKSSARIKDASIYLNPSSNVTDYHLGEFQPLNKFIKTKTRFPWFPCSPYYSKYKRHIEVANQSSL